MTTERLRARLEAWALRIWFGPADLLDRLLALLAAPIALPLSALVGLIARRRRARLRRQSLPTGPGEVPVIVVGNLLAGGTGKSPLVAAIAQGLAERGFKPGLVARGYRRTGIGAQVVDAEADPAAVGDEAAMLVAATGLPMAVAVQRQEAVNLLRTHWPDTDVIVADDGLQHVGLARAIEIAVIDGRGVGNGRCLPAGPLREPTDRLGQVDAIVFNGPLATRTLDGLGIADIPDGPQRFVSQLRPVRFRSLAGAPPRTPQALADELRGQRVAAIAGIARPQRFFDQLEALGIAFDAWPLADHARIDPTWLAGLPGERILMTAKDAVKCRGFDAGLRARCLYLDVEAQPEVALLEWLADRLRPEPRTHDPA